MSGLIVKIFYSMVLHHVILAWEALPEIPSGRRSEYYVLNEHGGYKYGYDTGNGIAAKQEGDASNGVQGHYFYTGSSGKQIDFKYTAGAQGFIPDGFPKEPRNDIDSSQTTPSEPSNTTPIPAQPNFDDIYVLNPDGSYSFAYATSDQSRKEKGDSSGNVEGAYSYKNQAGNHDLSYEAGANKGFHVTGGSLAIPNGLPSSNSVPPHINPLPSQPTFDDIYVLNPDGSYSFAYATSDQSRKEKGDSSGNVEGAYSYKNQAGNHDLSYEAGANKGFYVTGGSLAIPNGLPSSNSVPPHINPLPSQPTFDDIYVLNPDGSYSFAYATSDQSRKEKGDSSGNVDGSYSYKNQAGNHDLSYTAGADEGFQVTGGSLAIPNGLPPPPVPVPPTEGAGNNVPLTKASFSIGSLSVHTYHPPNEKGKFGYILDSKS